MRAALPTYDHLATAKPQRSMPQWPTTLMDSVAAALWRDPRRGKGLDLPQRVALRLVICPGPSAPDAASAEELWKFRGVLLDPLRKSAPRNHTAAYSYLKFAARRASGF
jgi:hypothetical protein